MKTPFLGSAYVARSVHAADNRMVNLFPEIVPEGGKEPAFLHRAPGLRFFQTLGDGPVRGLWTLKDELFVVSGNSLYKTTPETFVVTTPPAPPPEDPYLGTYAFVLVSVDVSTPTFRAYWPEGAAVAGVDIVSLDGPYGGWGWHYITNAEVAQGYAELTLVAGWVDSLYTAWFSATLQQMASAHPGITDPYYIHYDQIDYADPPPLAVFNPPSEPPAPVTTYGTLVGTVAGTGPVSMADNGRQLFIAAGGHGYLYDTETKTFNLITDENFNGAGTVGYLDGYFVFHEPDSQVLRVSDLNDGTVILPDFASAEGFPDSIVTLIVDHREVWVFGNTSVEVWVNSGGADFPLERIPGAFNEIGCAAPYSVAKLDNAIFWLGQDARGQGIVYRSNGYSGQRLSTHAIEWQIQQYGDLSDAIAYTYQQDGHSFYVLTFPSADATWVYDVATDAWHERAGFVNGRFTRHRGNCQAFYANEVIVGDCENGNLYVLDLGTYSDNGTPQKWLRSWRALPQGANDFKRTSHHSLQLDGETGVGLSSGQGEDAEVMLRWSDDGGHTWSNEHRASMGKVGQYGRRAIWRRLGMTAKLRDRVYEVSGTDPVKVVLLGADVVMG